jgi:hypothetical protein
MAKRLTRDTVAEERVARLEGWATDKVLVPILLGVSSASARKRLDASPRSAPQDEVCLCLSVKSAAIAAAEIVMHDIAVRGRKVVRRRVVTACPLPADA